MADYYMPDSRWKIYNINSKEEFILNYVVKGKFHQSVPKDIVDAYTTVEYMLAHSYYWWPMYDEAFSKVLMLLEMAVKIRATSLEISLKITNNKNKESDKKLFYLINEVCIKLDSDILKAQLHRARKIRNPLVHKDSNSYMGAMGGIKENLYLFVNLINYLFLTKEQINSLDAFQDIIKQKLDNISSPLAIREIDSRKIVIKTFSLVRAFNYPRDLLLISCFPVITNTYETLNSGNIPDPILIVSDRFFYNDDSISGTTIDNISFTISNTKDHRILEQYSIYEHELKKLPDDVRGEYMYHSTRNNIWDLEKSIYDKLWI